MMVETILESPTDLGMSDGGGGLPQWKREVLLRRAARGQPPPRASLTQPAAPPPDDEELRYGPGIVKRLQSRYLSLALRDQPRRRPSVLRRAASLDLLPADPPARAVPPAPRADPPAAPRLLHRDAMKRARSVDVLGRFEPQVTPPPPPPPPGPPAWCRPPRRAAPLLRPSERPPPDAVRAALRKFECRPRRADTTALEPDTDLPKPPRPPSATNPVLFARHSSPRRVGIIRPMPAVLREDTHSKSPSAAETVTNPPGTADAAEKKSQSADTLRKLFETEVILRKPDSIDTPRKLLESADTPKKLLEATDIQSKLFETEGTPKKLLESADIPSKPFESKGTPKKLLEPSDIQSKLYETEGILKKLLEPTDIQSNVFETEGTPKKLLESADIANKLFETEGTLKKLLEPTDIQSKPFESEGTPKKLLEPADIARKVYEVPVTPRKLFEAVSTPRKLLESADKPRKEPTVAAKIPRKVSVAAEDPAGSPRTLGVRLRGASPAGATSVVFNFCSRPDVPDYVVNDGLSLSRRRSESEEERDGATSPCVVRFVNDNVLINGRSSLSGAARDRHSLKLQFDDSLTVTFEYPSESSLLEEGESCEEYEAPPATPAAHPALPNNAVLGASSLSSYQPCKSSATSFQLGLTRPLPAPHPASLPTHDTIPPAACGDDAARAHSFSHSRDLRTDLLF